MALSQNSEVLNSMASSLVSLWKGTSRSYSGHSFLACGSTSPLSPILVFVLLLGYSYIHSLNWYLTTRALSSPGSHSTAASLMADHQFLYKNMPQLHSSFWQSLMPPQHTLWGAPCGSDHLTSTCPRPSLYPALLQHAGPYYYFFSSGWPVTINNLIFPLLGFIHSFCSTFEMSLSVLLSFLLASFLSVSFLCKCMFVEFS